MGLSFKVSDKVLIPRQDTEVLVEEALKYLKQRAERIPLQHITGEQEFMGLSFKVSDKVLIPRQDTEVLVEEALKYLKPGMKLLDLCTGSGCILLSLLHSCPGAEGTGADLSGEALQIAEENRQRLGIQADLIKSDLFEEIEGNFDRLRLYSLKSSSQLSGRGRNGSGSFRGSASDRGRKQAASGDSGGSDKE